LSRYTTEQDLKGAGKELMLFSKTMLKTHNTRLELGFNDVHRLHLNENPYHYSEHIDKVIHRELRKNHFYPDPNSSLLRRRLASFYDVDPAMVLVGNGTDELILVTALAFLEQTSRVITTESTFPGYHIASALKDALVTTVPIDSYHLSVDGFLDTCQQYQGIALAFICNPHNPTGTAISHDQIASIVKTLQSRQIISVFDEAYAEFAGLEFSSVLDFIRDGFQALMLRTFSKAYGLAGFRIGYVIGPASLIAVMSRVRAALPFSTNRLAQVAAIAALENQSFIATTREQIVATKNFFYAEMKCLGIPYVPSVANFVLIQVPEDSANFSQCLLKEHHILTRDAGAFGLTNHIRISMGTQQQMKYACQAIEVLINGVLTR